MPEATDLRTSPLTERPAPEGLFIPFRIKLLGAFLAVSTTVLGASLLLVNRTLTATTKQEVRRQLEVARGVFQSTLAMRERQLTVAARLLAGDFAFKQALATGDSATIASNARSLKERIGADTVWVADDEARLHADTSGALRRGHDVGRIKVVRAALENGSGTAVERIGSAVYQFSAVTVNAPDLIGLLVTGFRIDDALAAELKKLTLCDVTFATEASAFASTLGEEPRKELSLLLPRLNPGPPELIGPPGRQDLVLAAPIAKGVIALIQRSWDESLEPLRQLQKLLGLLTLAALAFATVLGYWIADLVTSSMNELVRATRVLTEGDYDVRVRVRSRDEVGQLGAAFNSMVAGLREREKIRSVLRKAVSKEIADELLKRGQINLGGEERLITVLFSDVRGFTTISEGLEPPQLVSELNEYFSRMARAIEEHRGVIDKYVGDAIMALFGAPLDSPADATNAQRAALGMRRALEALNADRKARNMVPWEIGIGLNTGRAVAGTLGSENRWSYTVIGDSVNLSSRLEGLTKHYGCAILVSGETKEHGGPGFLHRSVDLVRVKGRHQPVEVFELLGEGTSGPSWLPSWESGIRAYRGGALDDARRLFGDVLAGSPTDRPAAEYLARLETLPTKAAAGWDPAYTALEK